MMRRSFILALVVASALPLAMPSCRHSGATAQAAYNNAAEREKFYRDYNAKMAAQLAAKKAELEKDLAAAPDEETRKQKQLELDDTNRHLQDPDYFSFRKEPELPSGLTWETGMDQEELGSPDAKKGGTFHTFIQGNAYPPTIRCVGRDSNNAFRSYHWDDPELGLVNLHPNTGKVIPGIADQWATGPDGQSVYFHIDKDAKWSDGKKITSRDFVMAFYVYLSPYLSESYYRIYYGEQYWGITTYGDDYLCIRLAFAKPLAAYFANIVPFQEDFYSEFGPDFEARYNWRPRPTAGPYVIRDEDIVKGRSISLTRVKDWWARDKKYNRYRFNVDRIEYALVRDEEKVFQLFLRGDIDTYFFTSRDTNRWYEKTEVPDFFNGYIEKATFYNEYPAVSQGLYLNQAIPLLANQDIRIGLQYATNWEDVIKMDLRGDAERLNLLCEGYGEYSNPNVRTRPFSIDLARESFAKAGFTTTGPDGILTNAQGQRLSFSINYTKIPTIDAFALRLKEQAKRAGVEYRLEGMDNTASFQKVSRKEHEIALMGWGVQPPFPDYYQQFHSSEAYEPGTTKPRANTNNICTFADKGVDPILERNRNARSEQEVKETSWQIEQIMHDRAVWVPAYYRPFYRAGYWRWVCWPEDFNVRLSDEAERSYVYWIDDGIKKDTLDAKRTGRTFPEKNVIYDKYRSKTTADAK